MKSLMIVAALAGAVVTTSAFAQTTNPAQTTYPANTTTVAMNNTATAFEQGGWVAPDGVQTAPKTRAQVYHELEQAEQDGQLAYLNSTLYAH
jgi:hypothetical protein